MKIIRFSIGDKTSYGILDNDIVKAITGPPFKDIEYSDANYKLKEVRLLAPCTPSKIVCLGLNYRSHANEFNLQIPKMPILFLKPPTAVIGTEDDIIYPGMSHRVDYEAELAIVIKKRASHVSPQDAPDYILGYTCFNDVSARDLQKPDGQWTLSKSFDTFAPIGPCIETEADPSNMPLATYLNGELKQKGNTSDLIFAVNEIVCFVSHAMTLLPGDVIATGTPSGIGPMNPGDIIEIKIDPIGVLRNYVSKP